MPGAAASTAAPAAALLWDDDAEEFRQAPCRGLRVRPLLVLRQRLDAGRRVQGEDGHDNAAVECRVVVLLPSGRAIAYEGHFGGKLALRPSFENAPPPAGPQDEVWLCGEILNPHGEEPAIVDVSGRCFASPGETCRSNSFGSFRKRGCGRAMCSVAQVCNAVDKVSRSCRVRWRRQRPWRGTR